MELLWYNRNHFNQHNNTKNRAMNRIFFELIGNSMKTQTTTWSEFPKWRKANVAKVTARRWKLDFVGSKAKERILRRVLQEYNQARQMFRKTNFLIPDTHTYDLSRKVNWLDNVVRDGKIETEFITRLRVSAKCVNNWDDGYQSL